MSTLNEMVSRVRSSFKLISSDDILTNRVVSSELISCSIKLIKRETDKRRLFSSDNIFTEIGCLQMKEVPLSDCCTYVSPCMVARSVEKLPRIGENIYGLLIKGVYSIDGKTKFEYTDVDRYTNLLKLYPKKRTNNRYFWKQGNYLYISDPNIEMVKLIAFFEEFPDLSLFSCDGSKECPDNPLDEEFKCPGYLEEDVVSIVRETLLKTYKRSVEDKTEDDDDESK